MGLHQSDKKSSVIEVLVVTKELLGGTNSFIKDIRSIEKVSNYRFFFCLLRKNLLVHFDNKQTIYLNEAYPEDYKISFRKIITFLKLFLGLLVLLNVKKNKIVMTLDLYSYIILSLLKLFTFQKYRLIFHVNNNIDEIIQDKDNLIYRRFLQMAFSKLVHVSDFIVCVSKGLRRHLIKKYEVSGKI